MDYPAWLDLQCRMLPNVQRAIVALAAEPGQSLQLMASWPQQTIATSDLLDTANLAASRRAPVVSVAEDASGRSMMLLAQTLATPQAAVIVVELPAQHEQQKLLLQLLAWGESWLQLLAQQPASTASGDIEVPEQDYSVLAAACSEPLLKPSIEAAATCLAQLFGCQQVAIGLKSGEDVVLQGLAHNTAFNVKTNMARSVEELMAECLQHGHALQAPHTLAAAQTIACPAHQHYAKLHKAPIYSLPMCRQDQQLGVLSLQRDQPFNTEEEQRLATLSGFLGALFEAKQLSERSLIQRGRDSLRQGWAAAVSSHDGRGKYLLVAVAVCLGLLLMGSGTHRVAAAAKLEGVIQRAVVAPIDGYVSQAHARAGESVSLGQVIAELDDTELKLEYRRLQNQHDEYQQQYRKELADRNLAQSQTVHSQMAQAAAELQLLQEQLKRTQLTVPFDGVIIEGDLSRSLGAPVSKGQVLFEIAPLNEYRLVLNIDERDVPHVKAGQHGRLFLNAYPDTAIEFEVSDVATVFERDGALISYRTEARLLKNALFLRPGMQGLAKVDVGERRYSWMLSHSFVDWLSLKLWAWLP